MTQPEPGWYRHPEAGSTHYWDGEQWTSQMDRPASPWRFVGAGVVVVLVSTLLLFGGDHAAPVTLFGYVVGLCLALVGCVAAGVRLGVRWVDFERSRRPQD